MVGRLHHKQMQLAIFESLDATQLHVPYILNKMLRHNKPDLSLSGGGGGGGVVQLHCQTSHTDERICGSILFTNACGDVLNSISVVKT